jgi:transposase
MDNLSARKVAGIAQAIAAAGASILYLPAYSPDLNPIEQLFAKLKTLLRKAAARTRDELWDGSAHSRQLSAATTSKMQAMRSPIED